MKLGEFIKNFSRNNLIRLLYKEKGGHRIVHEDWNDVSMDWEINEGSGINRHYINHKVIGLASINFSGTKGMHYPEAINIVIEELENFPYLEDMETMKNSYNSA